ncbi:SDR family oxidoreductase [Ferrovibrio sp.]|uniref:SDR family NAD(P)-dependent oxidoreductase n=1 Tax=Ferrovibrio sp. TaxID=1917215 RepID=UPI001B3CE425|nr:SDR family oxidoreductase [Ferrovibrio sp.]MBP7064303.1 SDR family oxidoreductase [Ferrovibrio sp.]
MNETTSGLLAGTDLLKGDVAIITGAAQGNGRAIALGLAAAGAAVALGDVNAAGAAAVAEEIRGQGGQAFAAGLDVSDIGQCAAFVAASTAALGPASILVNNAGIIRRVTLDAASYDADWDDTLRVNLTGSKNMLRAALPQLRQTRGRVVNLGSIMSFVSAPRNSAYSASKGAIRQFTKALAIELAADGIRVNAIAPGVIATPMTEATRSDEAAISRFMQHTPMGRVGQPDELVGPVLFLVSRLSSYVTGTMLPVDGGYLAA